MIVAHLTRVSRQESLLSFLSVYTGIRPQSAIHEQCHASRAGTQDLAYCTLTEVLMVLPVAQATICGADI